MNYSGIPSGLTQNLVSPQVYNAAGNMGPPAMGPPPTSQGHISTLIHTNSSSTTDNIPMPPPNSSSSSSNVCGHTIVESASSVEQQSDLNITTSTTATVTVTSNSTVTSVITTGPDGTSLDEGSQQSTVSNASAGESIPFHCKFHENQDLFERICRQRNRMCI